MRNILPAIVFLTGIALSGAAAFYSISGLAVLFAGEFRAVIVMGIVLELAKLVSVSWLYNNWDFANTWIRAYLLTAIAILMMITSMGIFGYLSKAHIEQTLKLDLIGSEEIITLQSSIEDNNIKIKDLEKQIETIDNALTKMTERGNAKQSLTESSGQEKRRESLITRKSDLQSINSKNKVKLNSYTIERKKIEAEVGPLKYIAEAIYGESDSKILDKAVRFVIIIIILVFDPLAIFLLIAFNLSMQIRDGKRFAFVEIENVPPERPSRGRRKPETPY